MKINNNNRLYIIMTTILTLVILLTIYIIILSLKTNKKDLNSTSNYNNYENELKNKNDYIAEDDTIKFEKLKEFNNIKEIGKYNCPTIPNGFKSIETENASWEINTDGSIKGWNNGLVIEDEIGNQFVWIPVKNTNDISRSDGYYNKKQQQYLTNTKEADYVNSTVESKKVYESIKKYQGFYIARYEAGIENQNNTTIQDGSIKPLSKFNVHVWNGIRWGSAYNYALDGIQGSDTANGAVKVARSMYPDVENLKEYGLPKNLTNNTGVISTLIYGVQWDLTIDFLSDIKNPISKDYYTKNSIYMGNYEKGILNTGYYSVKNIYDMAGNVWEWTMESYKDKYRIYRGGKYDMGVSSFPSASTRAHLLPDKNWGGFRIAIFIK